MANVVTLPTDWDQTQRGWPIVDKGKYTVRVDSMTQQADGRIVAELNILDEGPFEGWTLYDSFSLSTDPGKRLFKEFTEAIQADTANHQIDLDACIGKELIVTVRHKKGSNEEVYANVTRHAPARQSG
jgi:hypothetical protein